MKKQNAFSLFLGLVRQSFLRLTPRTQLRTPALFIIYASAITVCFIFVYGWLKGDPDPVTGQFALQLLILTWVVNFFEAFGDHVDKDDT